MHSVAKQLNTFVRFAAALLAVLLVMSCVVPTVSATDMSGKVDGMEWSYVGGVLSVKGKTIPDFTEQNPAPWSAYAADIRRLDLPSNLESIGAMAFFECTALTAVQLPSSVKTVGAMAFAGCTALQTVILPSVTHIGEYAFSRCFRLEHAVLPAGLQVLDRAVFYRCESLRTATVPSTVTQMGDSVFAYCDGLLEVQIAASLTTLPDWTFYGCEALHILTLPETMTDVGDRALERCDSLVTVYQEGEPKEELKQAISEASPDMTTDNVVSKPEQLPPATESVIKEENGVMHSTDTTLEYQDGVIIQTDTLQVYPIDPSGAYAEKPIDASIAVSVTLTDTKGWESLREEVKQLTFEQGVLKDKTGKTTPLAIDIRMMDGCFLNGAFLESVAGKAIVLRLRTPNGCRWRIDCSLLKGYTFQKQYDLTYTLSYYEKISEAHRSILGAASAYWVDFADRIDFPAKVELYIDSTAAGQAASLYEKVNNKELKRLQSVAVGTDGVASYPMANVNKGQGYLVALNVGNVFADNVILNDLPSADEEWLENYVPVTEQYVITDVRGFMGLTMKQFTWIVVGCVGGLALVVFVIALVVNMLGKKKAMEAYRRRQ